MTKWMESCVQTVRNYRDVLRDFESDGSAVAMSMYYLQESVQTKNCYEELVVMARDKPTNVEVGFCPTCKNVFHFDARSYTMVCKTCGHSNQIYSDPSVFTCHDSKNYNCNPVHLYSRNEHFVQTLTDFAVMGTRSVPKEIMEKCRLLLQKPVTVHDVYNTLKLFNAKKYYILKYEIAQRINGKRLYEISREEIENCRMIYRSFSSRMMEFQKEHNIGKVSSRNRRRVFWPMKFILLKIFGYIGREDLHAFIRRVAHKQRLEEYNYYWDLLAKEAFPQRANFANRTQRRQWPCVQLGESSCPTK